MTTWTQIEIDVAVVILSVVGLVVGIGAAFGGQALKRLADHIPWIGVRDTVKSAIDVVVPAVKAATNALVAKEKAEVREALADGTITPDDVKRMIDDAEAAGEALLLDLIHQGLEGAEKVPVTVARQAAAEAIADHVHAGTATKVAKLAHPA